MQDQEEIIFLNECTDVLDLVIKLEIEWTKPTKPRFFSALNLFERISPILVNLNTFNRI